jgi:hypothetical protein
LAAETRTLCLQGGHRVGKVRRRPLAWSGMDAMLGAGSPAEILETWARAGRWAISHNPLLAAVQSRTGFRTVTHGWMASLNG